MLAMKEGASVLEIMPLRPLALRACFGRQAAALGLRYSSFCLLSASWATRDLRRPIRENRAAMREWIRGELAQERFDAL